MFVDTPGIHRPLHRMNVRMVDAAVETLREVDVVVLVFDASTRPGHGDEFVSKLLKDVTMPVVLVLNKIDLVAKTRLLPLIEQLRQWREFADIVPVSAATGDGVEQLERRAARADARRGAGALSGRLPDRSAGAGARSPRPCARRCCSTPAPSCRSRPRSSSISSTRPSASGILASVLHDLRRDRVAEADRHRPRRRR